MYKKHKQHRLPIHDYSKSVWYFITICTKNRIPHFGQINNGYVCISDIGSIAYNIWNAIPDHFINIKLDEYIVMPDHVHGIIRIINNNPSNGHGGYAIYRVPTINGIQKTHTKYIPNQFGPLRPGSLSSIIHSYKSAITRWCNQNGYNNFSWQSRFHDRIIRNERELQIVRQYIQNNPKNWKQ